MISSAEKLCKKRINKNPNEKNMIASNYSANEKSNQYTYKEQCCAISKIESDAA
jgi:hypothetical protein